jgi:hypothetical protein
MRGVRQKNEGKASRCQLVGLVFLLQRLRERLVDYWRVDHVNALLGT